MSYAGNHSVVVSDFLHLFKLAFGDIIWLCWCTTGHFRCDVWNIFMYLFFKHSFLSSHMYPENPEGTRVIVGSMNMGYDMYDVSDTTRNWTHNHSVASVRRSSRPQWWILWCNNNNNSWSDSFQPIFWDVGDVLLISKALNSLAMNGENWWTIFKATFAIVLKGFSKINWCCCSGRSVSSCGSWSPGASLRTRTLKSSKRGTI